MRGISRPIAGRSITRLLLCLALVSGASALWASNNTWEHFKNIRQGRATADDAPPPPPEPPPPAPRTQPRSTAPAAPPPPAAATEPAVQQPAAPTELTAEQRAEWREKKSQEKLVTAPGEPTEKGGWWAFYLGTLHIGERPYFGPYGTDFKWAYSRKNPLPPSGRIVVSMHGSGAGEGAMRVFGPSAMGDIEVRTQDAETYSSDWREWWTFGPQGKPYPGRRIAAILKFVTQRYWIDPRKRGIVLEGPSMGGAGAVAQTMILPDPWRSYIAYSSARAGVIMTRQINRKQPGQYRNFPPDNAANKAIWDSIDFSIQAAADPVVRGIHYRHAFSSDDMFSNGPGGNTQVEFVNLVEQHKIGGAFAWIKGGHGTQERGVRMPDLSRFEHPEQDVTLDRAHPAITNSTGNWPLTAAERADEQRFPRGHYNLGVTWNHANIVDDTSQLVFPLKYTRRTGFGKDIPDQPEHITVSVTPRRTANFMLRDGETLRWRWDGGVLEGEAVVQGDTVTIDHIPLVSGERYKILRIFR